MVACSPGAYTLSLWDGGGGGREEEEGEGEEAGRGAYKEGREGGRKGMTMSRATR